MQSPDVTKSGRVWSRPDHACRHRRRIETRGSFRRFRPTRRWTAPGATSSPAFRPSRALRERAQARSAKSLKWRSGAGLGLLGACFDESLKLGLDRKSVVSGKSVSVRVALGGRRIIKKKKNKKH